MTGDSTYSADIRWTTHGVAHIRADDWGSLGFGQGWASARDHLPTLLDQIVKVRSERSLHHGPGPEDTHLASDLGYRVLGLVERAAGLRDAQSEEIRAMVTGYVAGCNTWLEEALATDALAEWCAGAPWVRPIDELDMYAYLGDVTLMGSGRNLANIIGRAEAPDEDGPKPPAPLSALGGAPPGASNGWAFGGDATASGHGIVMANPHFPWAGEGRFWECHLTIPGEIDVYGASLLGTPGVQMGFNADVAWAHTFSRGNRFTLAKLDLLPGQPTSYRHGEEHREMDPTTYEVQVRGDDGELRTVVRTLWRSHHGPMVNLPLLGWGMDTAFTYRDANADNTAVIEQFLAMDKARSMDEFQSAFAEVQGMPWVNTLAADRTGRCWYIDASTTPNITTEAQERYVTRVETDMIAAILYDTRVALLDGSDPGDDWIDDPDAPRPGIEPFSRLPQLERRDVVVNANDSHWITHPDEPLEGFSPLHGIERRPLTLRTRQNLTVAQALAATGDATVDAVLDAVLDNTGLSEQLLREAVVARARAAGSTTVAGTEVDVSAAAEVLAAWDGRADLDSVGITLWRETLCGFAKGELLDAGPLFAHPFDPEDPVATPHTLAPRPEAGVDPVLDALGRAVLALDEAGVPIDAPLGEVQWAQRGAHRIPVHGAGEVEGTANVLSPVGALSNHSLEPGPEPLTPILGRSDRTGLTAEGYRCTYGTSFLMVVELTDDGPRGVGLLAYGQSGDPRSVHHVDGTEAYAAKAVRPLLFTDAEIEADPELVRRTITA